MEDNSSEYDIIGSQDNFHEQNWTLQKSDNTIFQPIPFYDNMQQEFINDLFEKHCGASTRIPGGNCILESVLTYMSNEQINSMINTVERFIDYLKSNHYDKEVGNVRQIFQNTPNSKYGDLCAYMRTYIYLYVCKKHEKHKDQYNCANEISELKTGSYITPNGTILSAFVNLTGCDILRINTEDSQPIFVHKTNDKKINYINMDLSTQKNQNSIEQTLTGIKRFDENSENANLQPVTITIDETEKKVIPLFFNKQHCTPAVHPNDKSKGAKINTNQFELKYHVEKTPSLLAPISGALSFVLGLILLPIFPPISVFFMFTGAAALCYSAYETTETEKNNKQQDKNLTCDNSQAITPNSSEPTQRPFKNLLKEAKAQSIQQQQTKTPPNYTMTKNKKRCKKYIA